MTQRRIPAVYMRGGTSKGVFFRAEDLPTDPATRDRLAGGLRDLGAALTEHLDLEESAVLPLIHDHLTLSEWLAPQKHAMKNGPKSLSAKLTMAGLILQDATPPERAWFLHEMPPPARLLWRLIGARQYRSGLQWRGSLG